MNNNQQLEVNMSCAKLLYPQDIFWATTDQKKSKLGTVIIKSDNTEFNIFTNGAQCLDVLKKLTDSNISIIRVDYESKYYRWVDTVSGEKGEPVEHYKEAIGLAARV